MAARPDDAPQRNWDSPNCKTRSFYRRIFLDGFWAWSLASHLVEILRRVGTRSAPHRLKSKQAESLLGPMVYLPITSALQGQQVLYETRFTRGGVVWFH